MNDFYLVDFAASQEDPTPNLLNLAMKPKFKHDLEKDKNKKQDAAIFNFIWQIQGSDSIKNLNQGNQESNELYLIGNSPLSSLTNQNSNQQLKDPDNSPQVQEISSFNIKNQYQLIQQSNQGFRSSQQQIQSQKSFEVRKNHKISIENYKSSMFLTNNRAMQSSEIIQEKQSKLETTSGGQISILKGRQSSQSNSPEKVSRRCSSRQLSEKKKVTFLIPKLSGFSPSNSNHFRSKQNNL